MVNPGSFTGHRKAFLADQVNAYAEAVRDGHVNDTVADIQRKYFKRFPITLLHTEEPTDEFLASVDDAAPDPEMIAPSNDGMDPAAYTRAQRVYELQIKELQMRKSQIKRRLHYQFTKSQTKKPTFEMGTTDPMAVFMTKLTGTSVQRPRLRTAYNLWGPANRCFVDPVFQERVRQDNVPASRHAALRSSIYKELFDELPQEERQDWFDKAEQEHQAALAKVSDALKTGASSAPEDRQRIIESLAQFAEPILDLIADHTGWKVSLIAGGPQLADGRRLHMVSVHSGTTSGPIKMDFGRSERVPYKEYIVPIFGSFLGKCYSVSECRANALPAKHNFVGLAGAEPRDGVEIHVVNDGQFEDDNNFVRVSKPRKASPAERHVPSPSPASDSGAVNKELPFARSISAAAANNKSSVKFGPPKAKKTQPEPNSTPALDERNLISASAQAFDAAHITPVSRGPTPPVSRPPTPTPTLTANSAETGVAHDASTALDAPSSHLETAGILPAVNVANEEPSSAAQSTPEVPVPSTQSVFDNWVMRRTGRTLPTAQDIAPESVHSAVQITQHPVMPSVFQELARPTLAAQSTSATQDISVEPVPSLSTQTLAVVSSETAAPIPLAPLSSQEQDVSMEVAGHVVERSGSSDVQDTTIAAFTHLTFATQNPAILSTPPAYTPPLEHSPSHTPMAHTASHSRSTTSMETGQCLPPPMSGSVAVPSADDLVQAAINKTTRKRSGTATTRASQKKKQKTVTQSTSVVSSTSTSCAANDVNAPSGSPPWVVKALELLRSEGLGQEWDSLIAVWLTFEGKSAYQGDTRLGTRNRPQLIADWIRRARSPDYRPKIEDIKAFAKAFTAWWGSLQPEWRIGDALTNTPGDVSWEDICCPGINGLLSILAALFFWGYTVRNAKPAEKKHWLECVRDVSFVITQLL